MRAVVELGAAEAVVNTDPNADGGGASGFHITGTWTGTITFEAKAPAAESGDWVSILATNVTDQVDGATTTANGVFRMIADGLQVRARMSTYGSGTAEVYPYESRL